MLLYRRGELGEFGRVSLLIEVAGVGTEARVEHEIVVAGSANRYGGASLACRRRIGDERAAVAVGCNIQRSVKIVIAG